MFKLKHLKISKFRNVFPGTELVFNDGFNVLLGQNGTGKTTLLKLISMVVRGDFSELKDEEVGLSYELSFTAIACQLSVQLTYAPSRGIGFTLGNEALFRAPAHESAGWSTQVALQLGDERRLMITANPLSATLADSATEGQLPIAVIGPMEEHFVKHTLFLMMVALTNDMSAPLSLWEIPGVGSNCVRFDESLGTFSAITNSTAKEDRGTLRPAAFEGVRDAPAPHAGHPHWFIFPSFLPDSLTVRLRTAPVGAEDLRLPSDELLFLQDAVALMKFRSAELRMTRLKKEVQPDAERVRYGDFKFYFTDEDGSQISHDYLSYGQKRLLAFLYYVASNNQIIVADELVNGMHHEWIEACRDAIGERQAFLTSQNPLLLDYLFFHSAEETRRTFLLCSSTVEQGQRRMRWGNLPAEDAADFFRAYEVGLQHVSAILRTKGLW